MFIMKSVRVISHKVYPVREWRGERGVLSTTGILELKFELSILYINDSIKLINKNHSRYAFK